MIVQGVEGVDAKISHDERITNEQNHVFGGKLFRTRLFRQCVVRDPNSCTGFVLEQNVFPIVVLLLNK